MTRIWIIEEIRELPEDNWFGVKRLGPHLWQIGMEEEMIAWTGDGGVVDYLNELWRQIQDGMDKD